MTIDMKTIVTLLTNKVHTVITIKGQAYAFQGIYREDGSGTKFNLILTDMNGKRVEKFVTLV